MHLFSVSLKHQKTLRFSDVFREQRKGALETNGLNMLDKVLNTSLIYSTLVSSIAHLAPVILFQVKS